MPVRPDKMIQNTCTRFMRGSLPSSRMVRITRKKDAMANRKKAAHWGLTCPAIFFPAIKVPPQKKAVKKSLTKVTRASFLSWFIKMVVFAQSHAQKSTPSWHQLPGQMLFRPLQCCRLCRITWWQQVLTFTIHRVIDPVQPGSSAKGQ